MFKLLPKPNCSRLRCLGQPVYAWSECDGPYTADQECLQILDG